MSPERPSRPRSSWACRLWTVLLVVAGALGAVVVTERVFDGRDPKAARHLPMPDRSELARAIAAATGSTVKIEGSACGLSTAGSGVVVADGIVLTAAHVVAGSTETRVIDSTGAHLAVALVVDPLADLAVVYSSDIDEEPVAVSTEAADRGAIGAVLGFPRGGALDTSSAVVLDNYRAEQHDIYGRGLIERQVLEVQAHVLPGSSGGPLVDASGALLGIVFGQSESDPEIGFAVATPAVTEVIEQGIDAARRGAAAVSTGACLDDAS